MQAPGAAFSWNSAFAGRVQRMHASEIRELLKVLEQPGILSFAGGIPDPALFPTAAIAQASADILVDPSDGPAALQYSVSEGFRQLREWIVTYMASLGVPCGIGNVVITGGSQQGLDFLAKLLLAKGDTALVTAPTYLGALQAFAPYEPRYGRLDLNSTTAPASYAEAAAAVGGRVALAYAVPDFANPTGHTMGRLARDQLLDLVDALGIPLIEDAAYSPIRFAGDVIPACLALEVQRRGHIDKAQTIYCGTFSKTIAPGLRVGWICAAQELIGKVVLAKQAADLHSPSLNQMIIHRVASAEYATTVPKVVAAYKARRDAMLATLDSHMPSGVQWTRPDGGMFIWLTLPQGMDGAKLLQRALDEERIAFVPGAAFFADGGGANTLRLNYSLQPEPLIAEGMRRLSRLIARSIL